MVDQKVLDKYAKILSMAERGEDNERKTAAGIAAKMRTQYPTLEKDYAQHVYETMMQNEADNIVYEQQEQPTPGDRWSPFWDIAQSFYETAAGFANTLSDAVRGTQLANNVNVISRLTKTDSVSVSFSLKPEILDVLDNFNESQRLAFRNAMLEKVKAELDDILFPPDD